MTRKRVVSLETGVELSAFLVAKTTHRWSAGEIPLYGRGYWFGKRGGCFQPDELSPAQCSRRVEDDD